jgi:D-glycero-D-manno-heptose 1,7-bisphosphate phosphatase
VGVGQVGPVAPRAGAARVAIFDRDGTIIDVVRDEETGVIVTAFHPRHIRLLAGAVEGMLALQSAGFILAIATNQPGPAKGQCSREAVSRTNEALVEQLEQHGVNIAVLLACIHHPEGGPGGDAALVVACDCRKPKPGMLDRIVEQTHAGRSASWMIGDGRADVEAARAAGLRAALLFSPDRCELCPLRGGPPGNPDVHGPSLRTVAAQILALG